MSINRKPLTLNDLDDLKRLRDEVRVQAHLLKLEAKDRWTKLEEEWDRLNNELRPIRAAAKNSATEISAAAAMLTQSLREGYESLRKALPK
jgi:hypothetical protein